MINYDPKPYRYKMKIRQLTPADEAILRRWRERAAAERRRKFPQFYKD